MIRRANRLLPSLLASASLAAGLIAPAAASAAVQPVDPQYEQPPSQTVAPPTFRLSARQALALAGNVRQVRELRIRHPDTRGFAYIVGPGQWELDYFARAKLRTGKAGQRELVQVDMDGLTGKVTHVWTGPQTDDYMARGHFAGMADSWWVWLPLCLLFAAPFFDPRRPLRMLHLDIAMLLAFGVSHLFFNQAHIGVSVPLVYPVLGYLLARMLYVGLRHRVRREALVPRVSYRWLAVGLAVLVAFRIGVNVASHQVSDIGYAGTVGADRIMHHLPLYVDNNAHGDTYGPVNYLVYVPFVSVLGFDGKWTATLAPAHAVSIAVDLFTLLGLFLLGSRLRSGPDGRRLGLALAYAWAAFPYTLFALALNTNDALVSALVVWAVVAVASPARRGLLVGLGAAAKIAPLALAPLLATARGERRLRSAATVAATVLAVLAVSIVAYWPKGGLHALWDCTLGYQLTRETDFSIWAQHPGLSWLQLAFELGAVALALALAFVPRRRDTRQVAALGAAVLIAIELPARQWFYFYIVWFAPLALAGLFAMYETRARIHEVGEIETAALTGRVRLPA